ncbi:MAG: thiamine-phosphate kinase [Burkholderiales bacterium]|nr:thiamine-phosphate kinase [Burkholderiales bacterium]
MSLGEFDLIQHFFTRPVRRSPLGVGDDCALLAPTPGMQLAVSTDMLVEGRHFVSTVAPRRLGHKALAVNLSDLAACGARPLAYTLAFALPRADAAWLGELAAGLHALADEHAVELVGGDTTAGPLNLCITVFGEVPAGQALLRSGAAPGDDLWVSGRTLGDARLALEVLRGTVQLPGDAFEQVRRAMEQPVPRVALGQALRGVASAAIDVSDGLLGDLGHVLRRSGAARSAAAPLGATLFADNLPRSAVLATLPGGHQLEFLLSGGDDYELLFTAPPALADAVRAAGIASATEVSRIGRIELEPGVRVVDVDGQVIATPWASFDHFR